MSGKVAPSHASWRSATETCSWEVVILFPWLLWKRHTSLALANGLSNYLMSYNYIMVPINWVVGGQFSREMLSQGLSPQLTATMTSETNKQPPHSLLAPSQVWCTGISASVVQVFRLLSASTCSVTVSEPLVFSAPPCCISQ